MAEADLSGPLSFSALQETVPLLFPEPLKPTSIPGKGKQKGVTEGYFPRFLPPFLLRDQDNRG